jgi:hypothetical protein
VAVSFSAPRISGRLRDEIVRLAEKPYRAAEICRAIGEQAEEQGFRRPSYEQVRLLVGEARRRRRRVSTAKVLLDVGFRVHHPDAFIQHVSGTNTRFHPK